MAGVLEKAEFSPAKIPVISNVTARPHGDSESIRKLLVQQVIAPVRWYQSIEYLRKAGVDSWLEVGPGRSLTGMMKKIDRRAAVTNISTTEGLLPQDKIS
jgi:[acyl-carrier-protein] S-malonyltransferase